METAVRWSSNSTVSEQRFLLADVAGRSFKHAKVTSYDGKSLKYDLISTYPKVPPFRAFDWAPYDENLVAVGQWSGEATILRIDDTATPLSLPTKHQRLCNAVTFSKAGLLATGLERVRNVECLNLWDINQRLSSASSPNTRPGKAVEPYRKFSSSGAISSIKFSIRTPEILIAGVKGFGIRIYDLREPSGNASSQFQTACVHNVAIDPLNENYFACCATGKDTTIQIWDCRTGSSHVVPGYGGGGEHNHQASPVLEYTEAFTMAENATPPTTWSSRFCKGKSGFLGALASNGNFKVFETRLDSRTGEDVNDGGTRTTSADFPAERLSIKRVHEIERPFDDAHQLREESERIVAFDFTNLAGAKGTPSAILLRGNGSISIQELSGPPTAFSLSALGPLSVSRQFSRTSSAISNCDEDNGSFDEVHAYLPKEALDTVFSGTDGIANTLQKQMLDDAEDNKGANGRKLPNSSRVAHEQALNVVGNSSLEEALLSLTESRRRSEAHYNLDPRKNTSIVGDDRWLQSMWKWMERAQNNSSDGGMVTAGFDLSYLGVFDIWRSDSSSDQDYRRQTDFEIATDLSDAVFARAETLEQIFPEWLVDSQEHRLVCLHTCGLGLSPEQVEITVKELISEDKKAQAAALAVFYNNGKLALEALRSGKVSPLDRELSLALAAYLNGLMDDGNDTWHETIQDLATDLRDPYARAILAIVSHGDWHDVLQETSLPLSHRVGIALMYLPEDELTTYINTITEEAIEAGDIEGIVLTGLGPKAISLFENYIRKFFDLQTAVLAFAFTVPRYFTDPRVEAWRQTYRHQLEDLNLFVERARFDTKHAQLSRHPDGTSDIKAKPRQVTVRCAHCENTLDRNPENDTRPKVRSTRGIHRELFGIAGRAGTGCPKCGRNMPRCVICLLCVGMTDPHSKGARAMDMKLDEVSNNFTSVCQNCWHVTHTAHAKAWFADHIACPEPRCDCRCREIDQGFG